MEVILDCLMVLSILVVLKEPNIQELLLDLNTQVFNMEGTLQVLNMMVLLIQELFQVNIQDNLLVHL